ncbi:MAG: hypothetical protein HZB73_03240 [Nitrosarchaeum sp.]|nr:hypothetical protein [Nitrosarchaeum sp.]
MSQKITFSTSKGTNSYRGYHSPKKENAYNNLQTIIVEKGTKRIQVRVHPIIKKNSQTDRVQKIVCNTCNEEIGSDICKVLVMRNKDDSPHVFHYHFFFPCWDFELLCKKYPNLTLDRVGVSIPENILMNESAIEKLKNNFDFWK